jgi:hypothetical protein
MLLLDEVNWTEYHVQMYPPSFSHGNLRTHAEHFTININCQDFFVNRRSGGDDLLRQRHGYRFPTAVQVTESCTVNATIA